MKKKQFVNYIHHSHTRTNEARNHHIRLLKPLAKMRNLTNFIDKPINLQGSFVPTILPHPSTGTYTSRFVWLGVLYKRTHRQTSGRNAKRSSFIVNDRLHLIVEPQILSCVHLN